MVRSRHIYFSVLTVFLFSASAAEAFVVQQPGDAISYNNIARDSVFVSVSDSEQQMNDSVDYSQLADKLLPETEPQKISIDLSSKSVRNVLALPGQTFFLILPETGDGAWHFSSGLLETISTKRQGNKRILELRALHRGDEKIFFDYFPDGRTKVTQSQILRLKVKKK